MNPIAFQTKWLANKLKERSASQPHFLDVCALVNHPTPSDLDGEGEFFTFERGATKLRGGQGWADVWYRNRFAWEYKGPGKDLKAAYDQLAQYREDLENPPLLIVSDLDRIEIHTNFTGTVKKVYVVDLSTITEPESLRVLKAAFFDPESLKPDVTIRDVTEQASRQFGALAAGLRERGADPREAAHFLMQLLFCLFAEDIGILRNTIFSRVVAFGAQYPVRFNEQIEGLLTAMANGGFFSMEAIPHVNGGLFREVKTFDLTGPELAILAESAQLDWSSIEPAIFGTLFERSLDPAKRAQLGAHYTDRLDIERVVDPVVMTPLRREWDLVRAEMDAIRATVEAAPTMQRRRNAEDRLARVQDAFLQRLAAVRVLDPACGSGNFLYVALERLLALEKEVIRHGAEAGLSIRLPGVGPRQLLGMEIDPLARELAQVAIWIGYLQWTIRNGFGWTEPVLEPLETIRLQDALITIDDADRAAAASAMLVSARDHDRSRVGPSTSGSDPERSDINVIPPGAARRPEESPGAAAAAQPRVTETVWPPAEFIIGNPPFLGGNKVRQELGDEYVETLFHIYSGRIPIFADLCCYFFEKSRAQIDRGDAQRSGLLATSSISGGVNREVVKRIKATGDIFLAWSNEPWILNGAAVRISIVGFDDGSQLSRELDGEPVSTINADLTGGLDISIATPLIENSGIAFQGLMKAGPFELKPTLAKQFLSLPANPNSRPNSDVIFPWVGGDDLVGSAKTMSIIDFGHMTEGEASLYESPFEYVAQHVKPLRDSNRDAQRRKAWWLFGRSGGNVRAAVAPLKRCVATSRVSKHRIFVWLDTSTRASNKVCIIAREDDYFFGVLHSRTHEVWSLRLGPRHGVGNDPVYTPTICFETFPLPWPPGTEPVDDPRVIAIGEAAANLDRLRRNWLDPEGATEAELKKRTLTNLYNARPTWLANAHAVLDRAVWAAYGWDDPDPAGVDEDTILSRLLALNGERAGTG